MPSWSFRNLLRFASKEAKSAAPTLATATVAAKPKSLSQPTDPLASLLAAVQASSLPPEVGMALIKRPPAGMSPIDAVKYANKIRDLCTAAGVVGLAPDFIASGTPVETARAQLLDLKADIGPEIITSISSRSVPAPSSIDDMAKRFYGTAEPAHD